MADKKKTLYCAHCGNDIKDGIEVSFSISHSTIQHLNFEIGKQRFCNLECLYKYLYGETIKKDDECLHESNEKDVKTSENT